MQKISGNHTVDVQQRIRGYEWIVKQWINMLPLAD
jgi:hypothetical protein